MPNKGGLPSYSEMTRLVSGILEAQRQQTESHTKLQNALTALAEEVAKSQKETQSQINQLIRYTQNRDKDLERCASTSMFQYLNLNFENAKQLSRQQRIFRSIDGHAQCEFDGGVVFEIVEDGLRNHYLALLEAKRNRYQFPSFADSAARICQVQEIINDKELVSPTIKRSLSKAIRNQRQFAGYSVLLFHVANNMDDKTRQNCLSRNISVLSPNRSNFNVDLAPASIRR